MQLKVLTSAMADLLSCTFNFFFFLFFLQEWTQVHCTEAIDWPIIAALNIIIIIMEQLVG
jgi:hypothetical protein